jgi:hypothetical protein
MHEYPGDAEAEEAMNKPLATLGAAAAGALAMYYLDPDLGARRRALLAELVGKGLPGGRRMRMRLPRRTALADPGNDAELRSRLQSRLGRMVSHPGAIRVDVEQGVVRLSGRVLAKEREGLVAQVRLQPGVRSVVDAMSAHDHPRELAGRSEAVSLRTGSS